MKQINTLIAVLVVASCWSAAYAAEQTQTFTVEKMTCPVCPVTVKKAMEKVDGVKSVAVNFDAKTATVTFDDEITTTDEVAAASTNAGYPAGMIQTGS
jgi:mercuric ion binding protein